MRSRALWHKSGDISVILEKDLPENETDRLLVESLYSLVSQGTERLVALGKVPQSIRQQMRVPYMEGSFAFPCKYGYSLVGKVIRGPKEIAGRLVRVMHPHEDRAWVDASSVYILPDGIPPARAVLAGNLETAVNALWDSEVSIGDSVLIAGFGLIGALIALVVSGIPGVKVTVCEINEKRCELAVQMGFDLLRDPQSAGPFDSAFNTTANETALQLCIDTTGYESTVTEVSFYGNEMVSLGLGGNFHTDRKRIIVSQVSGIPGKRLNRWDAKRRSHLVFELLRDSRYDLLIGNLIPFSDAPLVFDKIRSGTLNEISVVLKYQ